MIDTAYVYLYFTLSPLYVCLHQIWYHLHTRNNRHSALALAGLALAAV